MKKRIFWAIPLSDGILDQIEKSINRVSVASARWMPPENWHITVLFMGDVQQALIPEVVDQAQGVVKTIKPFSLKFKQIIFAPPQNPTRMIWAEFESCDQFNILCLGVSQKLKRFILENTENSNKPIPHVTLARLGKTNGFIPERLPQPKINELKVDKIQLMESRLMPQGSIYNTLFELDLLK